MTPNDPRLQAEKLNLLRENELFRGLSRDELARMAERAPMRQVARGTVFYSPEQPAEVLFILKQGRVRVFRISTDGRELTTAVLEEGSIFGEMALLGQRLHDSYAEALTPCLLCLMSREDIHVNLLSDARIAATIVAILGTRLLEAQDALSQQVFLRSPERLAALLVQRSKPVASLLGRTRNREVRYTHEELAGMLGTGRETVTKTLNEWAREGIVELKRGRVVLLRLDELERLSQR